MAPIPMTELGTGILSLVYPATCALCGAPGDNGRDLCAGCRADLPAIGPCCARCALPFDLDSVSPPQQEQRICGRCQTQPPPFACCRAAFRYEDPLPALVGGIKFRARMNLIRLLGNLLADALLSADGAVPAEQPQAILPVPLHPARLRQRGYNQALELARVVGRRLSIPVDASSCQRTRATRAQSELEERQRLQNIRGAFATTGRLPRHLAILDDVVTTGATVSELARALHRGGCERVDVWTLARTP
jgi:ComF family protein